MPLIPASLIDRLALEFQSAEAEPLAVVPVHAGRRGNPVLIGRQLFQRISELDGDKGARGLIDQLRSGVMECLVDDEAIGIDVDTWETLQTLQNSTVNKWN
jgi:molybdenum cofactor cytidylyltransferase